MDTKELLLHEQNIIKKAPCAVSVGHKVYYVRQVSNKVRSKIHRLEREAYLLDDEINDKNTPMRKVNRMERKVRTLHAKTAAYYLLNNWALFVPFLWAITWRILDLRDSEHTYTINSAGMNNRGVDFFLANWQITKAQLALSTKLVGDGIKQYQEKMESVTNMLEKDAFGIKEDNK